MTAPTSAAYFSKNGDVADFLNEFIKVRRLQCGHNVDADESKPKTERKPYRRFKKDLDTTSDPSDDVLLNVAKQMNSDESIHLDAFLSLMTIYDEMISKLPEGVKATKFNSSNVLKNSTITYRKYPKINNRDDIEYSRKVADELRYQRQTKDIKDSLVKHKTKLQLSPQFINGFNSVFSVTLTFVGAYSISGFFGVKDTLHKSIIGISVSFIALLVDTTLYLLRTN